MTGNYDIKVLPAIDIDRITALMEASSWIKTADMELVLAEAIKKFLNPPAIFKGE